jgi:23S rRNA (pseudouridine1915-N3)-methyltransferase
MRITFYIFESKPPEWVVHARRAYEAKLGPFARFEVKSLKTPSAEREAMELKRRKEGELLLRLIDPKDMLVLFDESGRLAKSSVEFSKMLGKVLESGKSHVVFCIGGPYGFSEEVRARAQMQWSLSPLTMNHWLAQLTALEQIYRGFTILKGLPYHNA